MKPVDLVKPILVDHDTELTYDTSDDVIISWTATDENPTDYNISKDGTFLTSESWTNGSNSVNLGNMSAGTYEFEIILFDKDNNYVSFSTTIIVEDISITEILTSEPTSSESPTNTTDPLGEIGSLISDNIVPIAIVSTVGVVSIILIKKIFGRKKKPKSRKTKKKK